MPLGLSAGLDLPLAWYRLRRDIERRGFVRHPFEVVLAEVDLEGWFAEMRDALDTDRYNPSSMITCEVPKGKGALRPGSLLSLADRLVYTAAVGACLPTIHEALAWSQDSIDYAYRLPTRADSRDWIRNQFEGWNRFRGASLSKLDQGVSYSVLADISGFYDNIDVGLLVSDLRQVNAPEQVVQLLSVCLNRWGLVSGRGIPQGLSPSDILAKLYLNSVDYNLRVQGFVHYRYVDDFRVFCRDRTEAKKALAELTRLLWKRGLSVQAAKSQILRADEARTRIAGVLPVLKTVARGFVERVREVVGQGDPYMSVPEAEEILLENPQDAPLELIREAYKTYFIESDDSRFDPTLFRFLLKRLGKHGDRFAIAHSIGLLERHPEETGPILSDLGALGAFGDAEGPIIRFLRSPDAVYPYQSYLIVEWLCEEAEGPSADLIDTVRRLAFDQALPPYVRLVAWQFLGRFGAIGDLERLEARYAEARGSLEQSEIICCLVRLERGRRNAFLTRAAGDGELNRRAVAWVRQQ